MRFINAIPLLALMQAPFTSAWLPRDKDYFASKLDTRAGHNSLLEGHRYFKDRRYIPSFEIRGVNLGSLFIMEPWMASTEWSNMGCGSYNSEFDCVSALGQSEANTVFQNHWATWITEGDLNEMASYGLNTIRIPLGYWIFQDLVYSDSEHFPQGQLPYLEQICGWATNLGMYIILDLHGAPGAQVAENAFTGQYAPTAGFYVDYQYQRAYEFLGNITELVYTNSNFDGVGMLEVVNEPISGEPTLISEYYPNAVAAIRAVENAYGIAAADRLNIQMMDTRWGAGDPSSDISDLTFLAYDDHSYLAYTSSVTQTQEGYLEAACALSVGTNWPEVVGEWSIAIEEAYQDTSAFTVSDSGNKGFYTNYFKAQAQRYETQDGWVFWSWKTNLGDYRWDYQLGVRDGVIPTNLDEISSFDCSAYT